MFQIQPIINCNARLPAKGIFRPNKTVLSLESELLNEASSFPFSSFWGKLPEVIFLAASAPVQALFTPKRLKFQITFRTKMQHEYCMGLRTPFDKHALLLDR